MKLEYKLSFMFAALMLTAGMALIILSTQVVKSELEQNLISRERIGMELLGKKLNPYFSDKNYAGMTGVIFEEKGVKKELVEYILVYGPDNKLIAHTFLNSLPDTVHSEEAPDDFLVEQHTVNNVLVIEMSMAVKDGSYDAGHIYVGYKAAYIENILYYISLMLTVGIVLIVFLTVALGAFIFKNIIVKPIAELEKTIGEISSGNLNKKAVINTGDELEGLAKSFNKMTSDLKESRSNIEQQVDEKTREVNDKMQELIETKSAVLNMMEDAEETNRELVVAREKLNANLKELKALDTKKDEFISIAAHELKTPLTAIHGFSQLLENEDVIKNAETRNNYLKVIDGETKRLANLVTEVLDLSRIDLGVIKYASDDINLYDIIEQIRGETGVKAKEKNLSLAYELEKGLPNIVADREKLIQIIINLVTNAEKYTEKGSINVKVQKAGNSVQLSVADTGVGIPKKHFPKMFTRFYQVDASYTRKVGGTGLGLSVCKEFVEGMGGRIWFESIAGKGSTFYFSLPLNRKNRK